MSEESTTTKVICPDCNRVHKKSEICECKKNEWVDANLFDR